MNNMILYHGSTEIIPKPLYGTGKSYNDYGQGFYCTEHPELAKEWACTEGIDGFANKYELDVSDLHILNLSSEEFSILHWIALLMEHRKFRITTPVMRRGEQWLKKHYLPDITAYDVIIGYHADDSYFSFARAFINNEISLTQLAYAMKLGKLGEQVVLKSPKAFEKIQFVSYDIADNTTYYVRRKARDDDARAAFRAELDKDAIDGIYMRDILRGEVLPDDLCIR